MRAVINNLKLDMSLNALYGSTDVAVGEENNKNMIYISAISVSGRQAADIANELANVFLNNYEKMMNRTVQKKYDYFSHQKIVVLDRIKNLEEEKKAYLGRYKISAADLERSKDFNMLFGAG